MQNSLSNFEEISSELKYCSQVISDDEIGLNSTLLKLKSSLNKISGNSEKYKVILDRVSSIIIESEDLGHEIDGILNSLDQSPERLNQIIKRIDIINNLLRKHSLASVQELSIFREKLAIKVNTSENIDGEIENLQVSS